MTRLLVVFLFPALLWPQTKTTVVLLGTGNPRPGVTHSGPATAVVVRTGGTNEPLVFLVDAGPGVEHQLVGAHLPINGVTATFITHLHSDHTLGYPDLIFTSWVMGRKTPLQVYGPHGLQNMTDHIIAAWAEDIEVRTEGLEHETPGGYKVNVHEIEKNMPANQAPPVTPASIVIYDSLGVRVTAIPVLHGIWKEAYGYRFDTPDRSVVISGDTRYCEELMRASTGVDVLVHEVYSSIGVKPENRPRGDDWPKYMREFHTSDIELGKLSSIAQPKLLVLTHLGRFAVEDELLAGVRKGGFNGNAVVGKDLGEY
jgi:ribonuclease BN (tRNA processing enzyme)